MSALLAVWEGSTMGHWSVGNIAILAVMIAAVCALVAIAFKKFGWSIPDWVVQVGWVLLVAFVVIMAIRLVMTM